MFWKCSEIRSFFLPLRTLDISFLTARSTWTPWNRVAVKTTSQSITYSIYFNLKPRTGWAIRARFTSRHALLKGKTTKKEVVPLGAVDLIDWLIYMKLRIRTMFVTNRYKKSLIGPLSTSDMKFIDLKPQTTSVLHDHNKDFFFSPYHTKWHINIYQYNTFQCEQIGDQLTSL